MQDLPFSGPFSLNFSTCQRLQRLLNRMPETHHHQCRLKHKCHTSHLKWLPKPWKKGLSQLSLFHLSIDPSDWIVPLNAGFAATSRMNLSEFWTLFLVISLGTFADSFANFVKHTKCICIRHGIKTQFDLWRSMTKLTKPCTDAEEPLIQPCRCRGSMSGVHASCVEEWIRSHRRTARDDAPPRCSVCHQPYQGHGIHGVIPKMPRLWLPRHRFSLVISYNIDWLQHVIYSIYIYTYIYICNTYMYIYICNTHIYIYMYR